MILLVLLALVPQENCSWLHGPEVGLGGGSNSANSTWQPRHREHRDSDMVFAGRIVDSVGLAVEGLVVSVRCRSHSCPDPEERRAITDETGSFRFTGRWSDPELSHADELGGGGTEMECGPRCRIRRAEDGTTEHRLPESAAPYQLAWSDGSGFAALSLIRSRSSDKAVWADEIALPSRGRDYPDLRGSTVQRGLPSAEYHVLAFVDGAWWDAGDASLPSDLGTHTAVRPDVRERTFIRPDGSPIAEPLKLVGRLLAYPVHGSARLPSGSYRVFGGNPFECFPPRVAIGSEDQVIVAPSRRGALRIELPTAVNQAFHAGAELSCRLRLVAASGRRILDYRPRAVGRDQPGLGWNAEQLPPGRILAWLATGFPLANRFDFPEQGGTLGAEAELWLAAVEIRAGEWQVLPAEAWASCSSAVTVLPAGLDQAWEDREPSARRLPAPPLSGGFRRLGHGPRDGATAIEISEVNDSKGWRPLESEEAVALHPSARVAMVRGPEEAYLGLVLPISDVPPDSVLRALARASEPACQFVRERRTVRWGRETWELRARAEAVGGSGSYQELWIQETQGRRVVLQVRLGPSAEEQAWQQTRALLERSKVGVSARSGLPLDPPRKDPDD